MSQARSRLAHIVCTIVDCVDPVSFGLMDPITESPVNSDEVLNGRDGRCCPGLVVERASLGSHWLSSIDLEYTGESLPHLCSSLNRHGGLVVKASAS